jgi:hypothetical protein
MPARQVGTTLCFHGDLFDTLSDHARSRARPGAALFLPPMARRARYPTRMNRDRMFQVLVVGGMALVGTAAPAACGGATSTDDAGVPQDAAGEFPSELPAYVDARADTKADGSIVDAPEEFPSELPAMIDAGDR